MSFTRTLIICVIALVAITTIYFASHPDTAAQLYSKGSHIIDQLSYPKECYYLAMFMLNNDSCISKETSHDEEACFALLKKTSRSFAAVISQLDDELRTPTCIFYLVLRALDTVEDDMSIDEEKKKGLLKTFHERLNDPNTCKIGIMGLGDQPEYVELLNKFDHVVRCMHTCTKEQQDIIMDITKQMADGMASFVGKESIDKVEEYNSYCHYVAGLVGIGLSRLFATASCEGEHMNGDVVPDLSDQMGIFLQKTNITRDYLEDVEEGRPWWPKEIWSKYASSAEGLRSSGNRLECLNEMVASALQHAPACINYMKLINDPTVFHFCAVPQLMAIATLDKLYNNPDVFNKEVKIRKGLALRLMKEGAKNTTTLISHFREFAASIQKKAMESGDKMTRQRVEQIMQFLDGIEK